MQTNRKHVILPSSGYENDLLSEIQFRKDIFFEKKEENLIWISGEPEFLWWPQWQLLNVREERIESISHASRLLRSMGRNWLNLEYKWHRRSALVQEKIPKFKSPVFNRGTIESSLKCGAWFLREPESLCFSLDISIPYRNGIISIPEDKDAPSRAYRKLDEVFMRIGKSPTRNERVIDLGSYPGGWTWVLSQLAGQVLSVDTVPLEGKMKTLTNVEFIKKDAFKLSPQEIGFVDWFFSDIICEPARLYALVNEWLESGLVKNFVCTIKFKGSVDFELLKKFESIPRSKIFHLNANKHELTWVSMNTL